MRSPSHQAERQGDAVDPDIPGPAAVAAGVLFGALSRLRRGRIFHPHGIGFTGTLTVERPLQEYAAAPLFARPGEHPVVIRFSRGAGLPEPLPDVLGLALRLVDVHGPSRHQDFVLATSADRPLLHHLLLPALRGFFGQSFSSLLPYRLGGSLRLVGAVPTTRPRKPRQRAFAELTEAARENRVLFRLAVASLGGSWSPVADLRVGERLPDDEQQRLAFTPWNTGGGIRPVGPLMGLRRAAYRGSQRGRGLPDSHIP